MLSSRKVEKILKDLSSESHFKRRRAIKKAAEINDGRILETLLLLLLLDEKASVRKTAAEALGKIPITTANKESKVLETLEKVVVNDPDANVQLKAKKALENRKAMLKKKQSEK